MGFSGRFMRACFVLGGGVVWVASLRCMWNAGGLGINDRRFLQGCLYTILYSRSTLVKNQT